MEINEIPKDKIIILFDGVCNLCDNVVQFLIKKDQKDNFRFVAIQSDLGQKILLHIGVNNTDIDSIIVYIPSKAYYYKSDAAFVIAKSVGGVFSLLTFFKVFPESLRNLVYDYIAKNRYKWYGKKENCMIPTLQIQEKFLA
jgi:predicted DCC family thiol-disulfide oxidoreductase YuxK